MTTTDARKRLAESVDRLERTRTHSIDPQTGQFTRLDQEDTMTEPQTKTEWLADIAVEAHRANELLTEIRDRLPERPTLHALVTEEPPVGSQVTNSKGRVAERRDSGWSIWMSSRGYWTDLMFTWESISESAPLHLTTDADRERVGIKPVPVPVPHPDEAHEADEELANTLARVAREAGARWDYIPWADVARDAREHIEAEMGRRERTAVDEWDDMLTRAEKAEADLARVTKERDEWERLAHEQDDNAKRHCARADRAEGLHKALRADVEEFRSDHRDWTVMRGLADALARDDARAEGRS
ncbi:hypothetical protein [Janibacter terrae]|uniref:hypothetical protein n=1 Tax=Janibacter terrae TaxID=103817 RepID=UPI0031FA12C4